MTFDNPIVFLLCSIGVVNGFLVSIYFLFFAKQKLVQNRFFGFLVLMLSIRIGKSVYALFSESKDLLIMQIGLSACFLIGVSLFYYLKSSVENSKKIPNSWKWHVTILLFLILVIGLLKPYKANHGFWRDYVVTIIYSSWGVYLLLSGFVIKHIIKKVFTPKQPCTTSELWLVAVFVSNVLIFIAYLVGYFWLYLVGTLTFSFVFYALIIFLLLKKNRETIFEDIPEKYESKKIDDAEATALKKKLDAVMKEKELFKNSDIKLKDLAKEMQISPHQLSQLLNDNLGKSYAAFVNEYRIEEAKKLLKENANYTLEAIGFESGFSSKSNFYATFKKILGFTPAEYKKRVS